MTMDTNITVSDRAARRIGEILKTEAPGTMLRVSVEGGGCSGFQYHYDFVQAPPAADDQLFGTDKAPVLVDTTSLEFIKGSMLDYVETLGAAAFEIKNPNAASTCGCGKSFN